MRFLQTVCSHNKGETSMVFHFAKLNSRIKATWPGRTKNTQQNKDTMVIDARQDCLFVIQDDDGFERIRLQHIEAENVSIVRADRQLQIWDIQTEHHSLLAIIEDPDNDGITTIEEIVTNKDAGFVTKNIDMSDLSAFKSGEAYNPCTNVEETGLALLAGNHPTSDTDEISVDPLVTVH